jgi:hypothetical protein
MTAQKRMHVFMADVSLYMSHQDIYLGRSNRSMDRVVAHAEHLRLGSLASRRDMDRHHRDLVKRLVYGAIRFR